MKKPPEGGFFNAEIKIKKLTQQPFQLAQQRIDPIAVLSSGHDHCRDGCQYLVCRPVAAQVHCRKVGWLCDAIGAGSAQYVGAVIDVKGFEVFSLRLGAGSLKGQGSLVAGVSQAGGWINQVRACCQIQYAIFTKARQHIDIDSRVSTRTQIAQATQENHIGGGLPGNLIKVIANCRGGQVGAVELYSTGIEFAQVVGDIKGKAVA